MKRRRFLTGLGLLPLAACARIHPGQTSKTHTQDFPGLASLTEELMTKFNIPGASVACMRGGQIVWSRGFGVKNSVSKTPVDDSTLFEAASISKTVFAYAALKLCERGIIGLDEPLVRYSATRFVEADPRLDRITARRVLSHSAGFAEWRSPNRPLIEYEPGSRFQYSGEGYYYLQSVLTGLIGKVDPTQCAQYEADFQVCATDFPEFMKTRLLGPFRMSHSGYLAEADWEQQIARGHDSSGTPIIKGPPRRSDVARYGAVGGLNMTALDYAKFLIEVVAPKPADQFRLSPASLAEMVRPQIKLPKGEEIDRCTAWALGWGVLERDQGNLLVHSGGQSGFRSLALASRERKSGFIVLTNSDNGGNLINHPKFLTQAEQLVTAA